MATAMTTKRTKSIPKLAPKTRPTLAEMKAQLAAIQPQEVYSGESEHAVAEAIATGAATLVTAAGSAGTAVTTFFDALSTSYRFQRAVAKGEIVA